MIEINGVKGFLLPGDMELLAYYASILPINAQIAEIGSFLGLSSLIMARSLFFSGKYGVKIFCIDTWEGSFEHQSMEIVASGKLYDTYMHNISESGLAAYFVPMRKDSVKASGDFADRSLDLIFIDGDHSFEGCFADLVAWYPKLKPGGIFLGHDCEHGVRTAVEKFLERKELTFTLLGVPPYSNFLYKVDERNATLHRKNP